MKTVHAGERSWTAAEIFVGAGRRPNVEGLGLEEVGVKVGRRGVEVDDKLRTSVKTIYAAGDVAGRWLFTHSAGYEAARAVRNMFLPGSSGGSYLVPWCTFTDPELAHAGLTEAQARAEHGDDAVARLDAGPLALRSRPRRLGVRRRAAHRHGEGPHRRRPRAVAERRRAHRRARARDRPQAQAHRPREPRARLSDDRDRDPAGRRRGRLRVGGEALLARALGSVRPGRGYRPGGWRATKPPVGRIWRVQRVPPPRSARRVEAPAGDDHERVAVVRVDRDPLARARRRPSS